MSMKTFLLSGLAVVVAGGLFWTLTDSPEATRAAPATDIAAASVPGLSTLDIPQAYLIQASEEGAQLDRMIVYKSPTCGCCSLWIDHLEENGFEVEVRDDPAMMPIKQEVGVPNEMVSCHTGVIAGRIVEGHVPADVIRAFLEDEEAYEKWAGIAVPGMPVGSPGMEVEGRAADPYDVVAFDRQGNTAVFASR
ncbi:MAG: DUF411 domain-containing protein [Gemmatimonadales bacterium]|nr:MAG: DUF411 domain-containing protein [Gemmatimonadales bacterium]